MPSSHLILCRPLLLLPPVPPSMRVFSNESTLRMRLPKYWSCSFSIIPSNEHPGLISFRMDRLDLLAVQGTLKNLLQHHSSKEANLWRSAFFTVQLSHPYMITGKTIALTRWTFVDKVIPLLFNILSRMVMKVKVKSLSSIQLLMTPWTAAYQAPPSMGFSRQDYWSGVPLPSESDKTEGLHFHFSLSFTGEGNGNPLQCSCLENPKDGGAW